MPHAGEIRTLVQATFQRLWAQHRDQLIDDEQPDEIADEIEVNVKGVAGRYGELGELAETVLIRKGCYYGRAYRSGPLVATLVADTERINFFTQQGRLLESIALGDMSGAMPSRRAA